MSKRKKADSEQRVQRIPIDPDGKQILIIYGLKTRDAQSIIVEPLMEWMLSDHPVFFVKLRSGTQLEFVRFPPEETEG